MKQKIKKLIENIFYIIFAQTNILKITKKLDKYEYVSFDIFDTLIKRNVKEPRDIFSIVENTYNEHNSNRINDFKKIRVEAEKKALKESSVEEVTLDEIYSYMNNFSDKEREMLKNLEIEVENEMCVKKSFGYDIFSYCKRNNKNIIITSDMYLPMECIVNILKKNGYEGIKKIYLSSNEKVTKRRKGSIYKKILSDLKTENQSIIHIGDHPISDFINARRNKIDAILIKK